MTTLLLATRNAHKAREIRALLGDRFRCLTLRDFPAAPAVAEDAATFAGNAETKAVVLARWLAARPSAEWRVAEGEFFVLADDSGLEVDTLGGAPGVHSARFAALGTGANGNALDADNNAKLLRLLQDVPWEKRTARFRCVIALTPVNEAVPRNASPVCYADEPEARTEFFDGACEGRIGFAPRGQNGFGYDPLFVPDGQTRTFAELGDAVKGRISHRAKALAGLKARWEQRRGPFQ